MRIKEWATQNSVSYWTALNWHHKGLIPGSKQLETGTIIVEDPRFEPVTKKLIGYARVSSSDQKEDLKRQADRLRVAGAKEVESETGSGLNGNRPKLKKLLQQDVDILVEHRDRLCRFGFEYLESALAAQGRKIVVLESKEIEDDLIRDMTEVLTSFCARLYGKRAAANRAKRGVECVTMELSES